MFAIETDEIVEKKSGKGMIERMEKPPRNKLRFAGENSLGDYFLRITWPFFLEKVIFLAPLTT